jgi:hypothetical protein
MKKTLLAGCVGVILFATGCQKDVTVVPVPQPQQQQPIIVNPQPQQPGVIVVPGRPQCPPPRPGVHIDINTHRNYRWCNRCGVWVHINGAHHCR